MTRQEAELSISNMQTYFRKFVDATVEIQKQTFSDGNNQLVVTMFDDACTQTKKYAFDIELEKLFECIWLDFNYFITASRLNTVSLAYLADETADTGKEYGLQVEHMYVESENKYTLSLYKMEDGHVGYTDTLEFPRGMTFSAAWEKVWNAVLKAVHQIK